MTTEQREKIYDMRRKGYGYKTIAAAVGLSKDTVKSYCQRNNLGEQFIRNIYVQDKNSCPQCGGPVGQSSGTKPKRFCSSRCRLRWWHDHPELMKRATFYDFRCANCGKVFSAYGNKNRKYCSRDCYFAARFGKGGSK